MNEQTHDIRKAIRLEIIVSEELAKDLLAGRIEYLNTLDIKSFGKNDYNNVELDVHGKFCNRCCAATFFPEGDPDINKPCSEFMPPGEERIFQREPEEDERP
jgi:hypothetical protein